jgi:hypothetical protein
VEEATAEAEKHGDWSELLTAAADSSSLTALVEEAKTLIKQVRAEQAERAKSAAEEAKAAAAVKAAAAAAAAAERLRVEEQMAAVTLRVQADMLLLQQMQAELGVPPAAPHPEAEETQCVVCMDAPKDRIVLPCMHLCACEACAQRLLEMDASCPVCRGPVERIAQVFS